MAKSKVYKDKHGLYIRTNGCVYRPVKAKYSYPVFNVNMRNDGTSSCKEGTPVKISNVVQTPFCKVLNIVDHREEWWHMHGAYMGAKTESCWIPVK